MNKLQITFYDESGRKADYTFQNGITITTDVIDNTVIIKKDGEVKNTSKMTDYELEEWDRFIYNISQQ